MIAPRLQNQLVTAGSSPRRWLSLSCALLGCALLIIVIARPYMGVTTTVDQISSRNILIALDTSRSMLVRDGSPDRITSAKAIAIELLQAFPDDRIGVIAFSGAPVLMAPLTMDHAAVQEIISQLDTTLIPSGGSDLAAAALLAVETFKKTGQKSNALIILSDGEDHSVEAGLAAGEIRETGLRVCAIGIGTPEGGIIPDNTMRDGKFRDNQGRVVLSRLTPGALQQISSTGRGTYLPASTGAERVIRTALSSLQSEEQEGDEASVPNERYHWFLTPAVILLVLSLLIRSHFTAPKKQPFLNTTIATGIITLFLILSAQDLHAKTYLEQAEAAYGSKDYELAMTSFSKALPEFKNSERHAIEFSIATSAYRLKQWQEAIRYFSQSLVSENSKLQEESHYSLANSLFQRGWEILNPTETADQEPQDLDPNAPSSPLQPEEEQEAVAPDKTQVITLWEDAISHYQAALTLNPEHADAEHNLTEVEKLLNQLKKEQEQEEQQQQQEQEQQDQEDEENEEEQEGEEGDQEQEGEEGEESEDESEEEGEEGEESDQEGDSSNQSSSSDQSQQSEQVEQQEGESEEEFSARILEEQSDLETRPVQTRLRYPKRPSKDW